MREYIDDNGSSLNRRQIVKGAEGWSGDNIHRSAAEKASISGGVLA